MTNFIIRNFSVDRGQNTATDKMSKTPNKEGRRLCYAARDEYFACLDANDDDIYKCITSRKVVEQKCPNLWIKHFEQTRIKKELLESQSKK